MSSELTPERELVSGTQFVMDSKILNEKRTVSISMPASYNSQMYTKTNYSVLYILDGEWNFELANTVVKSLSVGDVHAIPEMIVVGIHNTERDRDMTPSHSLIDFSGKENAMYEESGGAESFTQFIAEELQPLINKNYRTNGFDVLVGHSLAGLYTLNSWAMYPDVFDAQIAIDPSIWWDDEVVIKRTRDYLSKNKTPRHLIVTTAKPEVILTYPAAHDVLSQAKSFDDLFKDNRFVAYKRMHFEDESHASVVLLSLYQSLKYLFRGHQINLAAQYDTPESIEPQFNKLSERLGTIFKPRESFLDARGCELLKLNKKQSALTALTLFRLNTIYFPQSFHAWHSLGEGYLANNMLSKAKNAFEKSLELNSEWSYAKSRLLELSELLSSPKKAN